MAATTHRNILNHPAYQRYRANQGWRYDTWQPGSLPQAHISYRTMPGMGRIGLIHAYAYELTSKELATFSKEARKLNVATLKCFFAQPHTPDTVKTLADLGWQLAQHPKVPRSVIIKELEPDEEAVFNSFSKQGRNEARKGAKEGTVVEEIEANPANYERMLPLIEATYSRAGIHRSMAEKRKQWDEYARARALRFFIASHEGRDLACATLVTDGDAAWYLDGGSVPYRNQLYATTVLQAEVIKAAARSGIMHYDFLGVTPKIVRDKGSSHSMDGVTKFKQKFSEDFYDYIGVYELPIKSRSYSLFRRFERIFVGAYKRITNRYWY